MKDKFGEGMVVSFGTVAAQGLVEGAEKWFRHPHTNGHIAAFAVVVAAWCCYRLMKGLK